MPQPARNITFRLAVSEFYELSDEAKKTGQSPHEYARMVVRNRHEDDGSQGELAMKVDLLQQEVEELRKDLAVAVRALLITKGNERVTTVEEADRWVKANLKQVA